MRKNYLLSTFIIILQLSPVLCQAQTTNWAGAGEVEALPASWTYVKTPGWYFWAGAGVSFGVGITGMIMRFLRRDLDGSYSGGDD